jgi:hypothetical protein
MEVGRDGSVFAVEYWGLDEIVSATVGNLTSKMEVLFFSQVNEEFAYTEGLLFVSVLA